MTSNPTTFVDLENAREDEQRQVMQDIIAADHCPFCSENLKKYHKLPTLKESNNWIVTPNQWPYRHTKYHFLIIAKQHWEKLSDVSDDAAAELWRLVTWITEEHSFPGGGFAVRFGDTNYSGGTVKHLHAQVIQPDIYAPDYAQKPVRVKIGKVLESVRSK